MGSSEDKPNKRWGLRHTGTAASILMIGQVFAFQEVVFTRKEAEAQIRRIDTMEQDQKDFKKELTVELKQLNNELIRLRIAFERYNRNKENNYVEGP